MSGNGPRHPVAPNRRSEGRGRLAALLLGFLCLGWLTVRQAEGRGGERFLDVSLLARSGADYHATTNDPIVPRVDRSIIRDMVRDSQPDPGDLPKRLTSVDSLLDAPPPPPAKPPLVQPQPPVREVADLAKEGTEHPEGSGGGAAPGGGDAGKSGSKGATGNGKSGPGGNSGKGTANGKTK